MKILFYICTIKIKTRTIHLINMESNETLLDVKKIVMRAKEAMGFRNDLELADYLGIARSTLSNWIARNSMDCRLVLEKMEGVNFNWLFTGKGTPSIHEPAGNGAEVEILHHPRTPDKLDDREVPLYDIMAAANLQTLLENRQQYVMDRIIIPGLPQCDGAVFVSGDSMYPLLKSGDIIGFKMLSNMDYIIYGEMYLVSFRIDDCDYLVVKYVNRSEKEDCIRLVSYNPHHDPMDLRKESIQGMAIVKFSIRKHMMG